MNLAEKAEKAEKGINTGIKNPQRLRKKAEKVREQTLFPQ